MIWSLQILRFVAAAMVVYVHAAQTAFNATGSVGPCSVQHCGLGVDRRRHLCCHFRRRHRQDGARSDAGPIRVAANSQDRPTLFCVLHPCRARRSACGLRLARTVATFLPWPATDVMTAPLLDVAWTLSFEMLFYASATLILFSRWWAWGLAGLYIVAFCLRPFGPIFQFLGNPIIIEFLFGVAIARAPKLDVGIPAIFVGAALLLVAGVLGLAPVGARWIFCAATTICVGSSSAEFPRQSLSTAPCKSRLRQAFGRISETPPTRSIWSTRSW